MTYRVESTSQALDDIASLDPPLARRVISKIEWLSLHFNEVPREPLSGQFKTVFKLRVGDWRILYTVDQPQAVITVHAIGHRRQIYRT